MKLTKSMFDVLNPDFIEKCVNNQAKGGAKVFASAVQQFMQVPVIASGLINSGKFEGAVQQFITSADVPETKTTIDIFNELKYSDLRYEPAFKTRIFDANKGYFTIVNVRNGFQFNIRPEGGKIDIQKMSGDSAYVNAIERAQGFAVDRVAIEDRNFGEIIEYLQTMISEGIRVKSQDHYTLITDCAYVSGNTAVSFQGGGSDSSLARIRKTIDKGVNDILTALKDKGIYGDLGSVRFILYSERQMETQFKAAMMMPQLGVSEINTTIPISGVEYQPTYLLKRSTGVAVPATSGILVAVGGKLQRGDKVLPEVYSDKDILSFSDITAIRHRYGAGAGEPLQVKLLNFV